MKNKWFVGLATGALATAMCISFAACSTYKGSENGKSDADKVAEAIETLDFLYGDSAASTASDYDLVGHVVINRESIPVTWEAKSTAVTNLKDYVSIGTMDEDYVVPVSITRGEVDVAYTLVATVTSGKVSDTVSYDRVVPKGLAAKEGVVVFDFSNADGNGASLYNAQALALFNGWAEGEDTPLTAVETNTVYQGNGSGGGTGYEFEGGFLKMGKSSGTGSIKLTFAYPVTEVSVEAEGWPSGSTITNLTVNGSAGQDLPQKAADVVTFTLTTPATEVTVTSNGRAFLHTLSATWQEGVHHHVWEYEHTDGFKHTRTCTADDCTLTEKTETVDCQVFDSVCKLCEHTYTAKETVDALYALADGASLPGTYKLSGIVTKVEDANGTFHNVTPTITVEGKSVVVYRAVSPEYNTIKTGDTITAHGLLKNRSGVYEFDQGGAILSVVDGSKDMDDATKVSTEKDTFTLDTSSLKKVGDFVTLPATGVYGTTLSWNVPQNDYLSNENGKLTVTKLPETGSETITITLTITSGSEHDTKDFTVTISAAAASDFTPITAPTPGEDYYLAMDIKGTWYYSIGAMSTHFLGSTTEIGSAAKVTLAGDETNGYTLVTNGKYIEIEQVDGYNNIALKDSQTEGKVWKWDAEHTVFTMTVGTDTFFMGTYGDYTTFNAAYSSYLDDANEYIGRLGTYSGTVTPPAPDADIDDSDATVFDFSDVAVADSGVYSAMTDSAVLAEFKNAAEAGLTSVTTQYIYAGNNGTSGPNAGEGGFLRVGKSKTDGTLTLNFTKNVTKVQILCLGWSATDTITVDSLTAATVGTTKVVKTFELAVPAQSFTITTNDRVLIFKIAVTFASGDVQVDDADKVAGAKNALTLDTSSLKNVGDTVALPATGAYDTTIAWSVDTNDYLAVEGGSLKVTKLPDSGSQTITVTATITSGDAHDTKTFDVTLKAAVNFKRLESATTGEYIYSTMHDGTRLYATGISGNYLATTDDVAKAAKFTIEQSDGHWYIKVDGKYLEINPYYNSKTSKTSYSLRVVDTPTANAYWDWDDDIKIFKQKPIASADDTQSSPANAYYYIGMYDSSGFNTMSPSAITFITGSNAGKLDVSQHPARFGTVGDDEPIVPSNKTVTGFHDYEIWSDNAAVTINFYVDTEGYTKEDVQGAKLVIGSHEISPRASSEYMIGPGNQSKLWFEIHGLEDMNEVKLVLKIGSDSYDVVSTTGSTGTKTMNGKDYILGKDETNHLHITIKDAGEVPSEKSVDFNGGGAVYQDVGGRNRLLLQVKTSGYTTEELKAAYVKIGTKQFNAEPDSASTPGQNGAMFFFTDGIGDLTAGSYQIILHIGDTDYPVHTTVGLPGDAGLTTHTDGDKTVTLTLVGTESDKELHLVITGAEAKTYEVSATYDPLVRGYAQGKEMDKVTDKVKDVSVAYAKSTSVTMPVYYTTEVRIYHNGTITVSVPEGYTITAITLTFTSNDGNKVTANVGTLSDDKTWAGSETSVVFTVTAKSNGNTGGHIRLTKIVVAYTSPVAECTHPTLTKVPGTPAECEKTGTEDYWTCNECHRMFKKESAPTDADEIFVPVVIEELGHVYSDWQDDDNGATHTATCDNCHTQQSTEAHDKNGEGGKCSKCGGELTAKTKDVVLELTQSALGLDSSSYAANNKNHTVGDFTFNTNQAYANSTNIQMQKGIGKGTISNVTGFPGRIKSIVVVFDSSQGSGTIKLDLGTTIAYGTTKSLTMSGGGTQTFTADEGTDFRFFKLYDPSATAIIASISITYETLDTAAAAASISTTPVDLFIDVKH